MKKCAQRASLIFFHSRYTSRSYIPGRLASKQLKAQVWVVFGADWIRLTLTRCVFRATNRQTVGARKAAAVFERRREQDRRRLSKQASEKTKAPLKRDRSHRAPLARSWVTAWAVASFCAMPRSHARPPKVARFLSVCLSPIGFCVFYFCPLLNTQQRWIGWVFGWVVHTLMENTGSKARVQWTNIFFALWNLEVVLFEECNPDADIRQKWRKKLNLSCIIYKKCFTKLGEQRGDSTIFRHLHS